MRSPLRRGFGAVAAIALAITLLTISMAAPVVSTTTDFSIFNSGWNGTSQLAVYTYKTGKFSPTFELKASGTEVTVEQVGLSRLDLSPSDDALIIVGPNQGFGSSEGAKVGQFVREGGVLLLADDFGSGNSLLEAMNATSRFTGDLVMDLAFEKQPEFSVCFDISRDDTTRNVSTLLLNFPSSLTVDPDTTDVLARSSIASWLDSNGDRLQEWGEPRGPFPLIAREHMGRGSVFLLSDPSVLINGMVKELDNGVFATNLMDSISRGRSAVMFDESHRDFFDPVAVTQEFTGQLSGNAKAGLILLALVLTLWICTDMVDIGVRWVVRQSRLFLMRGASVLLPASWLRRREAPAEPLSPEQLIERLQTKHPEWRSGLIRYIVREKERHAKAAHTEPSRDD